MMALTIHLRPDVDKRLSVEAVRRGLSESEMAAEIIDSSLRLKLDDAEDDSQFILNLTNNIASTIPDDVLKEFPSDLSKNLDHYMYGNVKAE